MPVIKSTVSPITLIEVTRYKMSLGAKSVAIELRSSISWAVTDGSLCLSNAGGWHYEPAPSSRTDKWISRHRFLLRDAFDAAEKALNKLVAINKSRRRL